jgi:hypothetical protein
MNAHNPSPPRAGHALSPAQLEHLDRVMRFNWCVAAYAHPDWLAYGEAGSVGPVSTSKLSARALQRVSLALLRRERLMSHYLAPEHPHSTWLVLSRTQLHPVAHTLGVAMLGGWVRNSLERAQVAQQLQVLGTHDRAAAAQFARTLRALPFSHTGQGWPLQALEPVAVVQLGLGCLAALLSQDARECQARFLMRFPKNSIAALSLSPAQSSEASALVHAKIAAASLEA